MRRSWLLCYFLWLVQCFLSTDINCDFPFTLLVFWNIRILETFFGKRACPQFDFGPQKGEGRGMEFVVNLCRVFFEFDKHKKGESCVFGDPLSPTATLSPALPLPSSSTMPSPSHRKQSHKEERVNLINSHYRLAVNRNKRFFSFLFVLCGQELFVNKYVG